MAAMKMGRRNDWAMLGHGPPERFDLMGKPLQPLPHVATIAIKMWETRLLFLFNLLLKPWGIGPKTLRLRPSRVPLAQDAVISRGLQKTSNKSASSFQALNIQHYDALRIQQVPLPGGLAKAKLPAPHQPIAQHFFCRTSFPVSLECVLETTTRI